MKKICNKCGYIEESDIEKCPLCGESMKELKIDDSQILSNDIDAIIDSVLDNIDKKEEENIKNDNEEDKKVRISDYNPSIARINEKCINCGQCKKTCEKIVNISYNLNNCKDPICIGCGQCILNCPTGAMIPKYSYKEVKQIIDKNEKIVVALISPAVRVSIGEEFGIDSGENSEKKLVSSLKKIGFDYVFDTAFGADLTIIEEVVELIDRIKNKKELPQFTSCCPAWVKYCEIYHPELLNNISTCKSPIGMQCAIIKEYFSEIKGFDPSKIITVAITPCTSKKLEAKEYTLNIDYVLTASELSILLKEENIKLKDVEEMNYDSLLGESSGAGVLFGTSNGVCESAIKTLYRILEKKNISSNQLVFNNVDNNDGIKEINLIINNVNFKFAVVQQMKNLEELLKDNKYKKYHFIEVMNCKGGCIGGGGQPLCAIPKMQEIIESRKKGLYNIDKERQDKTAYDNNEIKQLYKEYLKNPLSEKCISLLHTSYSDKHNLLNNK